MDPFDRCLSGSSKHLVLQANVGFLRLAPESISNALRNTAAVAKASP